MSRKHDRSGDDEQSANLLLTGPIAIRGLSRGVKEALVRGRPSRHRAFASDGTEHDVDATPLRQMLAGGPTVSEAGPSSDLASHAETPAGKADTPALPSNADPARPGADGPLEDCAGGRGDDDPSDEVVVLQPTAEQPSSPDRTVDDWVGAAGEPGMRHVHADQPSLGHEGGAAHALSVDERRPVEVKTAVTDPAVDEPYDDFDALPVQDPRDPGSDSDSDSDDEQHDVVHPADEQPTAEQPDAEPKVPEDEPEAGHAGPDGELAVEQSGPDDRIEQVGAEQAVEDSPRPLAGAVDDAEPLSEIASPVETGAVESAPSKPDTRFALAQMSADEHAEHLAVHIDVVVVAAAPASDDEPGEALVGGAKAAPVVERSEGPEPEPESVVQAERRTPAEEPSQQGQSDVSPEGRPWVTAEQLFGLPPQPRKRDGVDGDAAQLVVGPPAAEEHLERPEEPAGDAPAEHASVPMPMPVPVPVPVRVRVPVAEPEPERRERPAAVVAKPNDAAEPEEGDQPVAVAATVPVALVSAGSDPGPASTTPPARPPFRARPLRERFGREAIGIAVLVVLALICAGLITAVVIKTRNDAAIAASEAAHYTPPPLATPARTSTGPVVAVIGDASTSSAASGVSPKQRWTSVLASSLGGTVSTNASSGMGYAAKSASGETFVQAAGKVPSDAKVVVFFGGAADSNIAALSLAKAATSAFAAAKQQAPGAKIVVVGPAVAAGVAATDLTAIRDTLHSSALVVKATWVDPIDKGWIPAARQSGSPSDLSSADEKTLASKMQAVVTSALG